MITFGYIWQNCLGTPFANILFCFKTLLWEWRHRKTTMEKCCDAVMLCPPPPPPLKMLFTTKQTEITPKKNSSSWVGSSLCQLAQHQLSLLCVRHSLQQTTYKYTLFLIIHKCKHSLFTRSFWLLLPFTACAWPRPHCCALVSISLKIENLHVNHIFMSM